MIAVIFDLDGTLVDSSPDLQTAVNAILHQQGRRQVSLDETRSMIGCGVKKLLHRAFAATGGPVSSEQLDWLHAQFLEVYAKHLTEQTRPYPQVEETLNILQQRGHLLGLCTNKPAWHAGAILEALGLKHFFGEAIVGGDSTPEQKPAAQPLLETMRLLGVERAVLVGDSETDIGAAKSAGIPSVMVSWGYGPTATGAQARVDQMSQLPNLLCSIAA